MTVMPMEIGIGSLSSTNRDDPRRVQLDAENRARVDEVELARLYYGGSQYDSGNADVLESLRGQVDRLPEHLKLIAYSTQIEECVDYVASQLGSGFQVTAQDSRVQTIVTGALSNSPDLASDDDTADINVTAQIRDALIAGDVGVHVRWDEAAQLPWLEFWESEAVDFQFDPDNRHMLERVVLTETVWSMVAGEPAEVERTREWFMWAGQCVIETYENGDVVDQQQTGLPFIPWRMWRGQRKQMRKARGESMVTRRIRDLADRYDAVEQLAFAIARYNSHGNLAVVGDTALLLSQDDARIRKDVADVLTFPGGTALQTIQLPTDPQMIEHQRQVILDALFSAFGVTRLDADTLTGLGQMSGYALEILNRKTEGTFDRIRRQLARDVRSTLNVALDLYAVMTTLTELPADVDTPWAEFEYDDPDEMFEDRTMEIVMGSGYVVDDVMLRDDYTAQLVSRRHVLRARGMADQEIDQIEDEILAEKPVEPEVNLSSRVQDAALQAVSSTKSGQTLSAAQRDG